jgi:hypothetical protein
MNNFVRFYNKLRLDNIELLKLTKNIYTNEENLFA